MINSMTIDNMKIYAHIDENNQILGWYNDKYHDEIPEPNIEVSEEVWQNACANAHNKINKNGTTEIFDFRPEEEILEEKTQQILSERNFLLTESDWTILPDAPFTAAKKKKWKEYRQALRDITKQKGFPENVVFPEKP